MSHRRTTSIGNFISSDIYNQGEIQTRPRKHLVSRIVEINKRALELEQYQKEYEDKVRFDINGFAFPEYNNLNIVEDEIKTEIKYEFPTDITTMNKQHIKIIKGSKIPTDPEFKSQIKITKKTGKVIPPYEKPIYENRTDSKGNSMNVRKIKSRCGSKSNPSISSLLTKSELKQRAFPLAHSKANDKKYTKAFISAVYTLMFLNIIRKPIFSKLKKDNSIAKQKILKKYTSLRKNDKTFVTNTKDTSITSNHKRIFSNNTNNLDKISNYNSVPKSEKDIDDKINGIHLDINGLAKFLNTMNQSQIKPSKRKHANYSVGKHKTRKS